MKKMSYDELTELGMLLTHYRMDRMQAVTGQYEKVIAEYDRLEPLLKEIDAARDKAQDDENIDY